VRVVCPRAAALGYILPPLRGSGGRRDERRTQGDSMSLDKPEAIG